MTQSAPCTAALEFETGRLRIRPLIEADRQLYCTLYTDPETMRFIGAPLTYTRAERAFRAALGLVLRSPPRQIVFTILKRASNAPIGICSLHRIDAHERTAEAGIILHADFRAHGYSREALAAVVDRAFELFPIDQVWVEISANYAVVERLVIGVGFTRSQENACDDPEAQTQIWRIDRESRVGGTRNP